MPPKSISPRLSAAKEAYNALREIQAANTKGQSVTGDPLTGTTPLKTAFDPNLPGASLGNNVQVPLKEAPDPSFFRNLTDTTSAVSVSARSSTVARMAAPISMGARLSKLASAGPLGIGAALVVGVSAYLASQDKEADKVRSFLLPALPSVQGDLNGYISYLQEKQRKSANKGIPQPATPTVPTTKGALPFTGGQCPVGYAVSVFVDWPDLNNKYPSTQVYGPIQSVRKRNPIGSEAIIEVLAHGSVSYGESYSNAAKWSTVAAYTGGYTDIKSVSINSVSRLDGQPDNCGDPPSPTQPAAYPTPGTPKDTISPPPLSFPTQAPQRVENRHFALPPGVEVLKPREADKPLETNKRTPTKIRVPAGGQPITIGRANAPAITITPNTTAPGTITIPPFNPDQLKDPYPITFTPDDNKQAPFTITLPGTDTNITVNPDGTTTVDQPANTGDITLKIPGQEPITFNPLNPTKTGLVPTSDPTQKRTFLPIPTLTPTPTTTTKPTTTPTTTPTFPGTGNLPGDIGTVIAEIGVLLTAIAANTTPEAIATGAATGTCRTTQPGGCTSNLVNNAANNAANGLKDKLDALFKGIDLSLLGVINNKLGAQVPGGISSLLTTFKNGFDAFVKWSQPGRILDMLTFILALHNAFMLSQNVFQTVEQLLVDWLKVLQPNFGKQPDGSEIDIISELNSDIHFWLGKFIGEERLAKYEADFKALNRIYQAVTNLYNGIQMVFFGFTMSLEVIGQEVGSIGNALKKYKVVGEKAFAWMNPNPNFKNKWVGMVEAGTQKITGLIAGAFALDAIAQGILQSRQAVDVLGKQKEELKKEVIEGYKTAVGDKTPEHEATAKAAEKSAKDSAGAKPSETDIANLQG